MKICCHLLIPEVSTWVVTVCHMFDSVPDGVLTNEPEWLAPHFPTLRGKNLRENQGRKMKDPANEMAMVLLSDQSNLPIWNWNFRGLCTAKILLVHLFFRGYSFLSTFNFLLVGTPFHFGSMVILDGFLSHGAAPHPPQRPRRRESACNHGGCRESLHWDHRMGVFNIGILVEQVHKPTIQMDGLYCSTLKIDLGDGLWSLYQHLAHNKKDTQKHKSNENLRKLYARVSCVDKLYPSWQNLVNMVR